MSSRVIGPLAWTLPSAVVVGSTTLVCWMLFALLSRTHPPSCELEARTEWAFALAAGIAGLCLPVTRVERRATMTAAAALSGVTAFVLAWLATSALFPRFC